MKQMLCGLVLVGVVGTLQVFAADIAVNNNSDSGPGSLRDAILRADASGGGIIRFRKKDSGTIVLQSPLPALTRNITVIGPGSDQLTIQRDVNSTSQLDGFTPLTISAGNKVKIQGLTLIASYGYPGGDIVNYGDLDLADCNFSGGTPTVSLSGGIYNTGTMTVSRCTFSRCYDGGVVNAGSMSLDSCVFTNNPRAIDGGSAIFNSGMMTLKNSTVSHNTEEGIANGAGTLLVMNCSITDNGAVVGGGIWNGGTLVVIDSTIARNSASYSEGPEPGGGIYNDVNATAMLQNTTISENTAFDQGGGIMNLGTLWLLNCTIASNLVYNVEGAGIEGGGVWNSGTVYSKNTIFAGNTASTLGSSGNAVFLGPDFFGVLTSQGFNLIQDASDCTIMGDTNGNLLGVDPLLGPLQDNGGPTDTHALLPGSPAINSGTNDGAPSTDQRGVSRPQGPSTDIGAFEVLYHGHKPAK